MAIDYSKPLATLLRDSTHEAHDTVATSQGAKLLLSGNLAKEEYIRYLMMLYYVYEGLERALDRHAFHPSLEPTYNPSLLARTASLSADIAHLLDVAESSWKDHTMHQALVRDSFPAPIAAYLSRIQELSDSADLSPLLAHSYVRYLGDLSGGQTMRHTIAKAYGLDEASTLGTSFYAFKALRSAKPASLGEMKRIKEWFRAGINSQSNSAVEVKVGIVSEAVRAFDLNAALFSGIHAMAIDEAIEQNKAKKVRFVASAKESQLDTSNGYPIASVLAVIAAVCITHFLLVVGGFTGNKGYEKLLAVEQWIASWQQASTD